jgi:hypothetical protein
MTKPKSVQQPPSKKLREGRSSNGSKNANAQPPDACELILDELRSRRERLQQLLSMIHVEVGRQNAARKPLRPRHKCQATRQNPDA